MLVFKSKPKCILLNLIALGKLSPVCLQEINRIAEGVALLPTNHWSNKSVEHSTL